MPEGMTYEVKIEGIKELIAKLENATKEEVILSSLDTAAANISGWVKENRLTGPRPQFLGVISGRLRSSISFLPARKAGDGYEVEIGTNVEYARIHEYGGIIVKYPRSSRLMATRFVRGSKKGAFKEFRVIGQGFSFGKHTINMPARPFLRPAIENEDNQQMVLNILTKNINKELEKQ